MPASPFSPWLKLQMPRVLGQQYLWVMKQGRDNQSVGTRACGEAGRDGVGGARAGPGNAGAERRKSHMKFLTSVNAFTRHTH